MPIDFSKYSKTAFKTASLTRDFGAELRLVYVINPHAYPFGDLYAALDPDPADEEAEDAAQKRMRSMAARAKARYSVQVIHGLPAVQICNAANEDVDLIVICTHGRTGPLHLPHRQRSGARGTLRALPGFGHSGTLEVENSQRA